MVILIFFFISNGKNFFSLSIISSILHFFDKKNILIGFNEKMNDQEKYYFNQEKTFIIYDLQNFGDWMCRVYRFSYL